MGWATPEVAVYVNAAGLALIGFYGWWLKGVVDVQVKGKDATIESLKTEVERLNRQAAPALAEYVNKMSTSLNSLAAELQTHKKKVEEFERTSREIGDKEQEWELERAALTSLNDKLTEYVDLLKDRTTEFSKLGLFSRIGRSGLQNALEGYSDTDGIDTSQLSWLDPEAGTINTFAKPMSIQNLIEKSKKPKD